MISILSATLNPQENDETPFALNVEFRVAAAVVFDVDVSLDISRAADATALVHGQLRAAGWDPSWLPRGTYSCHALAAQTRLSPGDYIARIALWHHDGGVAVKADERTLAFTVASGSGAGPALAWQLESLPGTPPIDSFSWRRGGADWFFQHFDHAARTTISYLLGDSPLLKGRILDVGCGDGITALGVALRQKPVELVGVDPFRGYERLPEILERAHMPADALPSRLRFLPADANELPFDDDHFDVVISWGSLEHIAGGHGRAFAEIRRVLKRGGLLMAHPGLFYSDIGNHLGEFRFAREEPYVHLKHTREWLRERILATEPDRVDRIGYQATPEQYWQWFTELNPITVSSFELELRALDFEPWRVALRTHERVDYTPELQQYSFVDLAVGELYVSAFNRKR